MSDCCTQKIRGSGTLERKGVAHIMLERVSREVSAWLRKKGYAARCFPPGVAADPARCERHIKRLHRRGEWERGDILVRAEDIEAIERSIAAGELDFELAFEKAG